MRPSPQAIADIRWEPPRSLILRVTLVLVTVIVACLGLVQTVTATWPHSDTVVTLTLGDGSQVETTASTSGGTSQPAPTRGQATSPPATSC